MVGVEGREARPVVVTSSRRTATLQHPPRLTGNNIIPNIASNNGIQLRQ
ncbi:Protein of unknown function [Pyronema omphalodes CBS 100304]|uniref:Uncharacterized protein n=1 Tax=Pyronema omphalodes (strain CBS 100304) TaxID=1076935 RepID=U4LVZ1_PYROM|nr:Protein of unknown function [Pyronema omphalodes CBS 100304]